MAEASDTPYDSGDLTAALEPLRRRLDRIDQSLVDLLAQRQALLEEVVAVKKSHHLPVYHPAREENIISQGRAQGTAAGLDPDYLEELFRIILRQSRARQAADIADKGVRAGAIVLLIGGRGGMGRYLARWLTGAGYQVRDMGRNDWERAAELCANIDLAIVCVPIAVTGEVIGRIGPCLPPECILADITSIKHAPLEAMLEAHSGPVIGLHPVFGPTTSNLDKQIVIVTPGRQPEACQWLVDQFAAWGSIIVTTTAAIHDEMMAIVQALRHFATFTFGQFLSRRQIDLPRTLDFSSPIYRLELGMVGRLFAQDPALYAEIIFATDERRRLLSEYLASVTANREMIEAGDKTTFITEFNRIAHWFGNFSDQAMRESTFLIDKLIERF